MAKNGKRKQKLTIPLAVVGGFIPITNEVIYWGKQGGLQAISQKIPSRLFGYEPSTGKFTTANLRLGLYPIVAGFLVHKVIGGMLGINRMLARSGVPFIRI